MQNNLLQAVPAFLKPVFFLSGLFFLLSCSLSSLKTQVKNIEQYVIDYSPPGQIASQPLPVDLQVARFSAVQAFSGPDMLYRSKPYRLDSYNYSRWRVNPADMVTDFLARDLQHSGIFHTVFTWSEPCGCRFTLEGIVREFLEIDENGSRKASLAVGFMLLDHSKKDIPDQVVFQKEIRKSEGYADKTPQGLAQAMSRAMQAVSGEIINEVYKAVCDRMEQTGAGRP